ncbi:MAG: hypothetical protein AAFN81_23590 [Bacteroidota bacterium]
MSLSRIDYIVYHNSSAVRRLIYQAGYQPPQSLEDLAGAVKALIRKQGRPFIEKLLKLHPDRKVLNPQKDCSCKACQGDQKNNKPSAIQKVEQLSDEALIALRGALQNQLEADPANEALQVRLRLARAELLLRRKEEEGTPSKRKRFGAASDLVIALSLTLLAGVLIGTNLKVNAHG